MAGERADSMENLKLEIRRYKPADAEDVFKLHAKALISVGAYYPGDGVVDSDFKDIEGIYINSGGDFLVGTVGDKIVAMGALKKLSEEKGEIKRMRTDPDFQRRGFAQQILNQLEARARELGFKSLELDSWVTQKAALEFYTKNGFQEYKREIGKFSGIECIFYRKML